MEEKKITSASIMQNFDTEVSFLIAKNRGISEFDALRLFLESKTYEILSDEKTKLWYFSPLAIYDMWQKEEQTGSPDNSLYLRGDEV